jgi:hypothetical protein
MCSALMYTIPVGVIQAYSKRDTNVMEKRRQVKTDVATRGHPVLNPRLVAVVWMGEWWVIKGRARSWLGDGLLCQLRGMSRNNG